jgi:hypothetical protein
MKKLVSVLFALLLVGSFAFAVDVKISGDIGYIIKSDDADEFASNLGKERIRIDAAIDDVNSVFIEFRNDAATDTTFDTKYYRLTTDISKALGLEGVGITTVLGRFEYWMSNWNSATSANRARKVEYTWGANGGDDADGAAALEVTVGKIKLHGYVNPSTTSAAENAWKVGVSSTSLVEGLNFIASYNADDSTDGYFKADAGYKFDTSFAGIYVPVSFVYLQDSEIFDWGVGVQLANIADRFQFNAGLGGKAGGDAESEQALDVLDIEVYVKLIETASFYVKAYTTPTDDTTYDFLQSIDFGLKNNFGAATFYVGYVYATEEEMSTALCEDDSTGRYGITGSGLYLAGKVSF